MKFFRKPSGYWVFVVALTIGIALYAWFHGEGIDPSPLKRVGYVAFIGMFALTARARLTGPWRTVVRKAPRDDARRYERDASARAATTDSDAGEVVTRRRDDLESTLRHRYGWRWRSLTRWIAVVGDEARVKSVVPGLVDAGYVIAGDTVLIHAKQNRENLDAGWLRQIRQLRRRRPIDAIAALTHTSPTFGDAANGEILAQTLTRHARTLRWAAPVYLIEVTDSDVDAFHDVDIVGKTWRRTYQSGELAQSLHKLAGCLANAGVARLAHNASDRYLAELSAHIEKSLVALCDLIARASESRLVQSSVQGLLFAPLTVKGAVTQLARQADVPASADEQHTQLPLWTTIAAHSRKVHGHRVGFSWSTTAAWATSAVAALLLLGSMISGVANRSSMQSAASMLEMASSTHNATQALFALDALEKQLDTLEVHRKEGAPLHTRFGLNHDAERYHALWPAYQNAASRALIEPLRAKLEERLQQLASLSDAEIASGGATQVQAAYDTLKTYLMLAHPEHADAAFLTAQLLATNAPARPQHASIAQGTWDDLRQ
ncbi:type VI secretion protein VasK, partial [Caballeronia jiangsuensis]